MSEDASPPPKSIGRQLKEQISIEKSASSPQAVAQLIGITAQSMVETIIADIEGMIDKGLRKELGGYVLSLSRIVKHELAWHCITNAFTNKNEKVPQKYAALFGQDPNQLPTRRGIQVE